VVDVLLGNATEKIARHRHEGLSVFGIGTELDARAWRSLTRQLVVQGLLQVDHEGFGALQLTDASRPLLRGEVTVNVREDLKETAPRKKSRAAPADVPEQHRGLWEALRECRRTLAAELNLPPYVIFHDATLKEMLAARPADRAALLRISGVGQAKLERYGDRFLAVLRDASSAREASPADASPAG
jgi:ATP-dependent DNA helicase RecQ